MNPTLLLVAQISLTLFVFILIPIYWKIYGAENFLWLSDIALFLTVIALWCHSSLLISAMVISILPIEIIWYIDFFFHLIFRKKLFGATAYMYDKQYPLFVRLLSLFHFLLLPIWVWCLYYWGYNHYAALVGTVIIWAALISTYYFSKPASNINGVFLPQALHWRKISPFSWFIFLMIAFPLFIILPLHLLLKHFLPAA